jgi:hypothetical protein
MADRYQEMLDRQAAALTAQKQVNESSIKSQKETAVSTLQKLADDNMARYGTIPPALAARLKAAAAELNPPPPAPEAPAVLPVPAVVPALPPPPAPAPVAGGSSTTEQRVTEGGAIVAPTATPTPAVRAATTSTADLQKRMGQVNLMEDSATKEMDELPKGIRSLYEPQLEDLRADIKRTNEDYVRVQQSNLEQFQKDKLITQIASVAETLAFNVFRFSAGMKGMNTGRDIASGLTFNPTNWHAEIQGLREDLAAKQKMAKDSLDATLEPIVDQKKEVTKYRDEDLKSRLEAVRERLSGIRGERRGLQGEKTQVDIANARNVQGANEANVATAVRVSEGEKDRELRKSLGEENADVKRELAGVKAGKSAEEKKEKERKEFETLLSGASAEGKSSGWLKHRASVVSKLVNKAKAAGHDAAYVDEIVKMANSADNWVLPDVGSPNEQAFKDKGRAILMQAYDDLADAAQPATSAPASPSTVPTQKSIIRTGTTKDGRKVIVYSDGTQEVR